MTSTVDGAVTAVDPRATRAQLARDLTRARGRIVALIAIVDAHVATIKSLRDEVRRVKRIAHDLTTDLALKRQRLAQIASISAVAEGPPA